MSPALLRTLASWTAALALLVGGAFRGISSLRRRRSPQREALWRELCLRLELIPAPGDNHSATGLLQGTHFALHDTGSAWLVELPLAQPLLPPSVILLPANEWRLRLPFKMRPLQWSPASPPSSPFIWYQDAQVPPCSVEAPAAFLEEAALAAKAHSPLRVEPRALVHALPAGRTPSVNDIRDAVRALEPTAQRWLTAVARAGLPRVRALPPVPSALALLGGVVSRRRWWNWLLVSNAALPLTLFILFTEWTGVLLLLLVGAFFAVRHVTRGKRYGLRGLGVGALLIVSTLGAPWLWTRDLGRETTPRVLWIQEATDQAHRRADLFRFRDGVIRTDLTRPKGSQVYPVVPEHWQPEQPVTVFAVLTPGTGQVQSTLGGTVVPVHVSYRQAAMAMAQEQRFAIHPHVLFMDFSLHPDDMLENRGQNAFTLLLWGFPNLLWISTVLARWTQKLRQSRRVLHLRILRARRSER